MSPAPPVEHGPEPLRRLLRERTLDLRQMDRSGFRQWLALQLQRWSRDPVFLARCRIRDLRRAHPAVDDLEAELRAAEAADRESPASGRLAELRQELSGASKAISGLAAALEEAGPERRSPLHDKLEWFRARRASLAEERENLTRGSAERQVLLRLRARLAQVRAEVGLDQAQEELERAQREQGQRSGRSGGEFERIAAELTRTHLLPRIARGGEERVEVLRGVTLGAAATELDQLVVRLPDVSGRPVEALAVVEVKRNLNDLAHGFLRRRENLSWLSGERDRYDPERHRTRAFPRGHFDREVVHRQAGREFTVAPQSFAGLRRAPGEEHVPPGLWLITRPGRMWGASAATVSRIAHRVSSDTAWAPEDDAYLAGLLHWCRSLTSAVEAPDVVMLYASRAELADRLLLVGG